MTFELQRLSYLIRHFVLKEVPLDITVFAEDLGERFAFYLKVNVMGQKKRVEVNGGPDGCWQMVRALFGLSYRRVVYVVEAFALFPHFAPIQDQITYRMETDCDAGIPEIAGRCGSEAGPYGGCPNLSPGLYTTKSLPPCTDGRGPNARSNTPQNGGV